MIYTQGMPHRPELSGKTLSKFQTDQDDQDGSIQYKFNSLGYRTKELSDFQPDDFVLTLGCSYTEGVGLNSEETWGYQMATNLGMEHMNLGVSSSGIDRCQLITSRYLQSDLPKPALVVVQHSELVRKTDPVISTHGTFNLHDRSPAESPHWRERHLAEMVKDKVNVFDMYHAAQAANTITQLWNAHGVPVLHWTFSTDGENYICDHQVHEYPATMCPDVDMHDDLARDQSHNGAKQHEQVAKYMTRRYRSMTGLAEPQQWSRTLPGPEKTLQDRIKRAILREDTQ